MQDEKASGEHSSTRTRYKRQFLSNEQSPTRQKRKFRVARGTRQQTEAALKVAADNTARNIRIREQKEGETPAEVKKRKAAASTTRRAKKSASGFKDAISIVNAAVRDEGLKGEYKTLTAKNVTGLLKKIIAIIQDEELDPALAFATLVDIVLSNKKVGVLTLNCFESLHRNTASSRHRSLLVSLIVHASYSNAPNATTLKPGECVKQQICPSRQASSSCFECKGLQPESIAAPRCPTQKQYDLRVLDPKSKCHVDGDSQKRFAFREPCSCREEACT